MLTMPAYNEADGIERFVREIFSNFGKEIKIIVCDDRSSDQTIVVLKELQKEFRSLFVLQNSKNLGHGPTFLRALSEGYLGGEEILITCDGDGQFSGIQLKGAYEEFIKMDTEVLEGGRSVRTDGHFRSVISFGTRILSLSLSGKYPKDGNTPLRIYRRETIGKLLDLVPDSTLVPNIWLSIISRMIKLEVLELKVESRKRLGENPEGTSWQGKSRYRKYKKLVVFCGRAIVEVIVNYRRVSLDCKKLK